MDIKTQKEMILAILKLIKAKGFRVFISKSETYGFYTDDTTVIYLQSDLWKVTASGQYETDNMRVTGQGWQISDDINNNSDFQKLLDTTPPKWAVKNTTWKLLSLQEYLTRSKHSQYKEI